MEFPRPLQPATFIRREKRFLIHAVGPDGTDLVAHTNNTGRMTGCLHPGGRIWLSPAADPARKLKWSLEIVDTPEGVPVGVNTALANTLAAEAITAGLVPALAGCDDIRREVKYGTRGSRIDLLLAGAAGPVWVEVKNVSLVAGGHGRFPDAPSERGRKHLRELMDLAAAGERAVLLFCSQRPDARTVGPADDIDPAYGRLLREALAAGVTVVGVGCDVSPQAIVPARLLDMQV